MPVPLGDLPPVLSPALLTNDVLGNGPPVSQDSAQPTPINATIPINGGPSIPSALPHEEQSSDMPYQEVTSGKRKRCRDIDTKSKPTTGLVVLFTPADPTVSVESINSLRLSDTFQELAPSCIIEVRPNKWKNVIAVDTRNGQTTQLLLKLTTLCGIKVRAFEPRGKTSSVGVIHDVDPELTDAVLLASMRSDAPIKEVRRLGKSRTVRIEFQSPTLPEHAYVGLVRHQVTLHVNSPLQCKKCGHFGHVSASCKREVQCLRCAKPHSTDKCDAPSPCCINCKKSHETTSMRCSQWQKQRSICRYSCENNIPFAEARAEVNKSHGSKANVSKQTLQEDPAATGDLAASDKPRHPRRSRRRSSDHRQPSSQDPAEEKVSSMETEMPTNDVCSVSAPALVSIPELNLPHTYAEALRSEPRLPTAATASAQIPLAPEASHCRTASEGPRSTTLSALIRLAISTAREFISIMTFPGARTLLQILSFIEPLIDSILK